MRDDQDPSEGLLVGSDPAGAVAMRSMQGWTSLKSLTGLQMKVGAILDVIRSLDKKESLFRLASIAGDLANSHGGILSPEGRKHTHDLLVQRIGSTVPAERAIAQAVAQLGTDSAIAHGHVLFHLQALILLYGADSGGKRPHGEEFAFLMLALNDYIPEWREASRALTNAEEVLGISLLSGIFNRTFDDPLKFVLRTIDIMGGDVAGSPITASAWEQIQQEAFGCSLSDYAIRFLLPIFFLSRSWGSNRPPVVTLAHFEQNEHRSLFERWFREAAAPLGDASWVSSGPLPNGLPSLSGGFFRTPFVRADAQLLCLSPWHFKDHVNLGTWGKMNTASKRILKTESNRPFTSTFGYLFERWCASIAREAAAQDGFRGTLLVPSSPGHDDEIEDVIVLSDNIVVLFSAKSSLVPESSLKAAARLDTVLDWLTGFFFEGGQAGKSSSYSQRTLLLLDAKIQKLRSGVYKNRGIRPDSIVVPVIVSYDHLESPLLYKWLESECVRLGIISSRPMVRPLTVLSPETYEAVLARGADEGVADLLMKKTEPDQRWGQTDWFLAANDSDGKALRLPSMERRFKVLADRSTDFMQRILRDVDSAPANEPK